MTEPKHFADLRALGFEPSMTSEALVAVPTPSAPAKPIHQANTVQPFLAAPGVDPRNLPVADIVLDPHLLDEYPSLDFDGGGGAAYRRIFEVYKSYGRNKERNGALGRLITSFITNERRRRQTGGMVTETIKTTKQQRDNAALLAAANVDDAELAEALAIIRARRTTEA